MLLDYIDEVINAYDDFMSHDNTTFTITLVDKVDNLARNRYAFNKADENLLYFADAVIDSFKTHVWDHRFGDGIDFESFSDLLDKIELLKGYRKERIIYKHQSQVLL